ncbi:pirin family protein [Roseococcus sp. SDR]|uniref:pirin family protein n=1 Tax=Roseococcus sp. SDR TaxID=2835532 RepID=UPI001BCDF838|nr:pirin family protein [Roseococcus sp. SDR]MBS7791446.1 pirin family protein [Roseococcus sp. SDR]MBV1846760.1 pirin family protein [Roseococcus sp. SDR]
MIESVILPRAHDVGGFEVRRALPTRERQMIGPFIFFDQMGPGEFLTGQGLDVRPHPHIGLSTVTYLFEGEILHRDSLGSKQPIQPGALNWMTAGQGIAHSERTAPGLRAHRNRLFGIQSWAALPASLEETAPAFAHHPAEALPVIEDQGARLRLVAGEGWGQRAPVETHWPLFYADLELAPGADCPLPDHHEERGAYVVQGAVSVAGQVFDAGRMLVFRAGDRISIRGEGQGARLLLLGGAVMDGPRHIFWNFVSSRRERIEQAKADWAAGRFAKVPGDDKDFIPLPVKRG